MNLKVRDRNRTKNRLNKTSATLVCKGCNKMFPINIGEICWHYDVGNLIPEFCPTCRTKKKEGRVNKQEELNQKNTEVIKTSIDEAEEKLIEEN